MTGAGTTTAGSAMNGGPAGTRRQPLVSPTAPSSRSARSTTPGRKLAMMRTSWSVRRAIGWSYSNELVRALPRGGRHAGGAVRGGQGPRPRDLATGDRGVDAAGGLPRLALLLRHHRPLTRLAGARLARHRGVGGAGDGNERPDRPRERARRHLGGRSGLRAEPDLHGRAGRRALRHAAESARLRRDQPGRCGNRWSVTRGSQRWLAAPAVPAP